jgi:hypothetical protein
MQSTNLYQRDLTSNSLKYIAIIAMFFDHFFAVFLSQDSMEGILSRIPGRVVAPIMCYLIAEGFFYTSNVKKYINRMLIFAAISHFPYVIYFGLPWWGATSVIWSLTLGLIALAIAKNDKLAIYIKGPAVILLCILAVPADWNYVAVLWILFFGIFRGQFNKQIISFAVIGIVFHIIPSIINLGWGQLNQLGIFLAIPILVMYKGRRGKKSNFMKWGFYVFYPLHLILLYLLYRLFV